MTKIYLGYDPGGDSGVAILWGSNDSPRFKTQSTSSVDETIKWLETTLEGRTPIAAGIDTFLFWQTGPKGWREADCWLKQKFPAVSNSIFCQNSAYGAMAVQGMAMAIRMRERWPAIQLNETHPKILYYALSRKKYNWASDMKAWLKRQIIATQDTDIKTHDEWDALISAWAAMKGDSGESKDDLRCRSKDAIEPAGHVTYWWPPERPRRSS